MHFSKFRDCDPTAYEEILRPLLPSLRPEVADAITAAFNDDCLSVAVGYNPDTIRLKWLEGTKTVTLDLLPKSAQRPRLVSR
jgi:hypothetical protein